MRNADCGMRNGKHKGIGCRGQGVGGNSSQSFDSEFVGAGLKPARTHWSSEFVGARDARPRDVGVEKRERVVEGRCRGK